MSYSLNTVAIGFPLSMFAAIGLATMPIGSREQVRGWELEYLVSDTLNDRADNVLTPSGAKVELDCKELRYKWQDYAHDYYLEPFDQATRTSITDVVLALIETKMVDVSFELNEDNIALLQEFLNFQNKLPNPQEGFVSGENFELQATCE